MIPCLQPKRRRSRRRFLQLGVEPLEERSLLATIMVTSLIDNLTAGGGVTLREAIQAANTNQSVDGSAAGEVAPAVDTIVFQPGLTGSVNLLLGQLVITETVIIQGLGAGSTTINAQHNSRVFDITSDATAVTFDGLTLTGGTTPIGENGGAMRAASGQLTVRNSTISGNTASSGTRGGGIWSGGTVTVTNSTVSGNSILVLSGRGGGVFASDVIVVNSTRFPATRQEDPRPLAGDFPAWRRPQLLTVPSPATHRPTAAACTPILAL